jgi:hypothetical protein
MRPLRACGAALAAVAVTVVGQANAQMCDVSDDLVRLDVPTVAQILPPQLRA